MKLTIVIPALNEEQAIASIIERTLAARQHIISQSCVQEVEIIVVNDGSTDRTPDIARQYQDVQLIDFKKNRGYGAAIKAGFEAGTGELVSFLDADGTCDPTFFADLCHAIESNRADVALGSRMSPESRMPRIRRIGNRIYAFILSLLSNRVVTDTASGMRVIRRAALERLYPLPDGLHFTPAMSARVLMDNELTLVECPMSYEERIGQSKLNVLRDGWRFLRTIGEMSLMWQPSRMLMIVAVMMATLVALLGMYPVETWAKTGRLQEDMIYRLLFCSWLATISMTFISAGVIADLVHGLAAQKERAYSFLTTSCHALYTTRGLLLVSLMAMPVIGWLVGQGIWTRVTQGVVEIHWSRVVLAGLIAFGWSQMTVTILIANILRYHIARRHVAINPKNIHVTAPAVPNLSAGKLRPTSGLTLAQL